MVFADNIARIHEMFCFPSVMHRKLFQILRYYYSI